MKWLGYNIGKNKSTCSHSSPSLLGRPTRDGMIDDPIRPCFLGLLVKIIGLTLFQPSMPMLRFISGLGPLTWFPAIIIESIGIVPWLTSPYDANPNDQNVLCG